jgi:uncharacterized protein YbjT (DUF2867 family)
MKTKMALVAGATGLIGGHCLNLLLDHDAYHEVVILVRREMPLSHKKLRQVVIDFNDMGHYSQYIKADDVFCCLGSTIKQAGSQEAFRKVDYSYPLDLARIALSNGAHRYLLVSSLGADPGSKIFYTRVKGEVEAAIAKLGYGSFHVFRPSLLLGKRRESRPGEGIVGALMKALDPFMAGPFRKYRAIEAAMVARAMVRSAQSDVKGMTIHNSEDIRKLMEN